MSFIKAENGAVYAPGYFLVHPEDVTRETCTVKADHKRRQVCSGRVCHPGE